MLPVHHLELIFLSILQCQPDDQTLTIGLSLRILCV